MVVNNRKYIILNRLVHEILHTPYPNLTYTSLTLLVRCGKCVNGDYFVEFDLEHIIKKSLNFSSPNSIYFTDYSDFAGFLSKF